MTSNLKFPLSDKWNYVTKCVPIDSSVIGNTTLSDGDGTYIYLNNANNTLDCTGTFSFYGANLQYPLATKEVLYINDIDSLRVTATIQIGNTSNACDTISSGCPVINPMSWTAALIGVPMYDEISGRNLWLEISPYWTQYADFSSNPLWLYHGESSAEELYRIKVSVPMYPGEVRDFNIDTLSIIKNLQWGQLNNINWGSVHIGDGLYFGMESWGRTFTDMYIRNIDFTYEKVSSANVGGDSGMVMLLIGSMTLGMLLMSKK
jgi:hypothetical protein